MNKKSTIKEYIEGVLNTGGFAVLATEGNSQPHASFIAITPFGICGQIIFATYRNTLKYRNISRNNKVAVLIESRDDAREVMQRSILLTIIGQAEEIGIAEYETAYQAHLKQHPDLESFMRSSDCVLIRVIAISYQVVYGIDEIKWITAEDLVAT
jgi:hypothetical protein